MNQNYMNYFNPASTAGMSGVDGGNSGAGLGDFGNQASFLGANMPPSGGSFMDMINSGPPPMMNTPGQQMARYNHPYSSMYGPAGYGGMENSAMRLQQFASRQITPRHFNMTNQVGQDQMNPYYIQQMRKMRMMSMQDFGSQRFNNPQNIHPGWPRNMMPNMPPHLQQMSPPPNRISSMMQNTGYSSDVNASMQIQNMQSQQSQPPGPFRKMPVLDEAPPSLRGPSPFPQQQQQSFSPQYSNHGFSANQTNAIPTQQNASLDLNASLTATDNLNLPNINFPSPQPTQSRQQQQSLQAQQPQQQPQLTQQKPSQRHPSPIPLQQQKQKQSQTPSNQPQQQSQQTQSNSSLTNFLNNFNADANSSLGIPQSPKLTHFGPSPASVGSTGSFEQALSSSPPSTVTQVTQTLSYTSPTFSGQLPQSTNTSTVVSSVSISSPTQMTGMNPSQYFKNMAQIREQINLLKQGVQTAEKNNQIQLLNQQYTMIYKQYEAIKNQNQMPSFLEQMSNRTLQNPSQMQPPLYQMPSPRHSVTQNQPPTIQQHTQMQQQQSQSIKSVQNVSLPQMSESMSTQQIQQHTQSQQQTPPQMTPRPQHIPQTSSELPKSQDKPVPVSSEFNASSLLEDSLTDTMDSINMSDFDGFEKVPFFNDDSKSDSLFSSVLAGSDLFPSTSLFDGDSFDGLSKTEDINKKSENTITPIKKEVSAKSYQELSSTTTVLSSGDQKQNVFPGDGQINQNMYAANFNINLVNNFNQQLQQPQQQHQQPPPHLQQQKMPETFLPFPFNQNQFHPGSAQQLPHNIMMTMTNFMNQTIAPMPTNFMSSATTQNPLMAKPISSLPGMSGDVKQEIPKVKSKGKGNKGKGGKGTGKGGKGTGKGKAGRPLGSLNKKKRDEKSKKLAELEPDDFDNLPPDEILSKDSDDPAMRRSLRERHKNTNYKDDFDYNISDEDEGKKSSEGKEVIEAEDLSVPVQPVIEPVISGGANQLVGYRPNLEVEGEIAIIEKILAMRTTQKDEVKEEGEDQMVEEFFVKYKGYSYLHCEWGSVDYLAKKDKRVYAKVKRYKQKRDTSFAFLNELDDEPFNPDYVEIDRVLDHTTTTDPATNDTIDHYLVKWRALPYEDSTWELKINIDESVIQHYEEMKKPPPAELRRVVPRPHELEWQKLTESPVYKNGNRLRDYQLEGLNWLTFCWYRRINCILADEMGLGKTVQSISLLCAMKKYGIRGPFLVIAPLSTIGNWQREFENWTDINAIVYHGSLNSRNNIQQYEMYYKDEQGERIPDVYKFEAIITTYEIVLSANSFLCTIPFRCLVIDEAHRLKNQKCKLLEGLNNLTMEHKLLLTGTPLQNNTEELFSLLNFLEPTRFPSQAAFMFEFGELKSEAQVDKLKQILKPMMLRRLKEDVETNIASKEETIVEVELTTIQKKFYRAILERNFSFLAKGSGYSNLPNLMNTMMELRKCCNHPFLIKGARDKIASEYTNVTQDPEKQFTHLSGLIESSGKMVLIDKLLPKLKSGGHKVLVFSQMIKVLDLIQEYLIEKRYQFERIDGGVQGNMRQAAIDRFCRPDSDRFVFLLCTRAGGLGINLTAADTVIIFDSDWNPQNDLQAQARCHRIGQEKPVKVYRLICRNTYEREMFDRASLKLGLDKAVLQNINQRETPGQKAMSKKEVEDLLKKGAYGAVMETDEDANKFCEEDIDQILQRRTQIIQIQGEGKGSTFSKASFVSDKARIDVDLDDPDFWKKWAKKASVNIEELEQDKQLIMDEPRKRKQTKRFGNDGDATVEMSDLDSDDETYEPHKNKNKSSIPIGPIERAAWTRVECFKVEKLFLVYGWDRWQEIISHAHFRQEVKHSDVEAISRTILAYCYRFYKTDERSKQFFVDLINESVKNAPPKNEKFDITNQILGSAPSPKGARGRKRGAASNSGRNALRRLTHQYSKPALIECGADWLTIEPEQLIIDKGYRKHLQHHCSKIMSRIRLLHCIKYDIVKQAASVIMEGKSHEEINIQLPITEGDVPTVWWDETADKSLLIGTFKHGYEKYRNIRNDPCLFFYNKLGPMQFNEKIPGSPDSVNNPASVERVEDVASDPESITSTKKKKVKKEGDEEDSIIDSDEEKDVFSTHVDSPASVTSSTKETAIDLKTSNNPDTKWPSPTDLNTRLRRLFTAFMRFADKEHLDTIKAEKDKIKQVRLANIAQEKQRRKAEMQQRWTRREESDFYKILSTFGVVLHPGTEKYNWEKFRHLAKLDKKQDETLTVYYEEFMAMCRKICGKATEDDMKKLIGSHMEEISEDKANRCIQRVKLLSKIRTEVLTHEKLEERLSLCQKTMDFPHWWKSGKHDKALLKGVAKHGLGRTEYLVLLDPQSDFKEMVDKIKSVKKESSTPKDIKNEPMVNGEHGEDKKPVLSSSTTTDSSDIIIAAIARKPEVMSRDSNQFPVSEVKMAVPVHTNEYVQLLSSWPKEKSIVIHLEKVSACILKGEWPKPSKLEIHPMVTKLPVFSRPLVSTVGHFTSAELTNEKHDGIRGDVASNRDFKIKSIHGLKLTVKKDQKNLTKLDSFKLKRKRIPGSENDSIDRPLSADQNVKMEDMKFVKKKRFDDDKDGPRGNVQIHIPNSSSSASTVTSPSSSKPIIHFPSNVKIPKVSTVISSKTSTGVSVLKHGNCNLTNSDHKLTVVKVLNEYRGAKGQPHDVKHLVGSKSSDQPVGIHINSPNSNVRIQGSKIEVKENPSIKRELDLNEVILKVPDPSKFMVPAEGKKQRVNKVPRPSSKPPPLSMDKPSKICEHKRTTPKERLPPPEPVRRRPERSAKKRAKDSISEITEAERPISGKGDVHDRIGGPISSPHHWHGMRSPPPSSRVLHGRELYSHMDFYERSPPHRRSPDIHRHRHSPLPFHRAPSPGRRSPSPPLHSLHRPLSPPMHHRHSHSPPLSRHHRNHSPRLREHEEHMNHYHFTEPLSPHYRGSPHEPPFLYSERSRSPYYYEYRHEKERLYEELERRSPSIKQRRLSPSSDLYSPHHNHEYIHIPSEAVSPAGSQRSHREHHSPNIQEGRFPYGRVDWDSPRYRHEGIHSPSIRSSPVESQIQYQPLSRMAPKDDVPPSRKHVISPLRHGIDERDHHVRRSRSPLISPSTDKAKHDHRALVKRSEITPAKGSQTAKSKDSPTNDNMKAKTVEIERTVIEIPEIRSPPQRITPTRKKGLGLLEMKIQGLKSKMQQSGISEKIKEKLGSQSSDSSETDSSVTTVVSPSRENPVPKSKSLSDVISSLSEKSNSTDKTTSKRTKSIADVTKNLTKSLEKSTTTETQGAFSTPKDQPRTVDTTNLKPKISASKLSDVISTLKEKSKAAKAQLPASKFKDVSLSSRPVNDSKLLDILKRGNAGVSPKELKLKMADQKGSKPVQEKKEILPVHKFVISPVLTSPERSLKSPPLPRPSSKVTSPVMSGTSDIENNQNANKAELAVSPKSNKLSPPSVLSPKLGSKSPNTVKLKTPPSRSSPRLSPQKQVDGYSEEKKLSGMNPGKNPSSSLSPNVDRSGCSPSLSLETYSSPINSPVYSPAIKSSPVTVPVVKPGKTRDESSATPVITPTRTPTPVQSPLSNTLNVVRSPEARLDSNSPGFPASPPQLVKDTNHTSKLTKPTAIVARAQSHQENNDDEKLKEKSLAATIISDSDNTTFCKADTSKPKTERGQKADATES